jgi:cell division protein FtsB
MPRMLQDDPSPQEPTGAAPTRSRRRLRPAHEWRDHRRRLVTWALVLGSFILIVNALFGENGYLAAVRMRQEYRTLSESLAQLKADNARTLEMNRGLTSDPRELEGAVRRQLGLIRPGEKLIMLRNARPASTPPASK